MRRIVFILIIFFIFVFISKQYFEINKSYCFAQDYCFIHSKDTLRYADGKPLCITNRMNGKREGAQIWYYENGEYWKIFQFKNDSLNGPWIEYYEVCGTVKSFGEYKSNKPIGLWKEFYFNNKIKSEGKYCDIEIIKSDINSENVLLVYNFDQSNKIKDSAILTNNLLDSLKIEFGYQKNDSFTFPIKRFIKDGEWKYYNEFGNIWRKELYDCGKIVNVGSP